MLQEKIPNLRILHLDSLVGLNLCLRIVPARILSILINLKCVVRLDTHLNLLGNRVCGSEERLIVTGREP